MRERIARTLLLVYTLLLIPTAVFYLIADFGKGWPKLYGFVLLFLCLMFLIGKFQPTYVVPFLLVATVIQLPAIFLYWVVDRPHFNWYGEGHSISAALGMGGHALFFLVGTWLAFGSFKAWKGLFLEKR